MLQMDTMSLCDWSPESEIDIDRPRNTRLGKRTMKVLRQDTQNLWGQVSSKEEWKFPDATYEKSQIEYDAEAIIVFEIQFQSFLPATNTSVISSHLLFECYSLFSLLFEGLCGCDMLHLICIEKMDDMEYY